MTTSCPPDLDPNKVYRWADDGWIYDVETEEKIKKWLVPLTPIGQGYWTTVWETKLRNIPRLESRRWFFLKRMIGKLTPIYGQLLQDSLNTNGEFYGYRQMPGKKPILYMFEGRQPDQTITYGLEPEPEKIAPSQMNQQLADRWFSYWSLERHLSAGFHLYDAALFKAIECKYADRDKFQGNRGPTYLHLIINGRNYWFQPNSDKYPSSFFSRLAYPENTNVETVEEAQS